MARSLGLPADQPSGSFLHLASGTSFQIMREGSGMVQRYVRGSETASQRVAYVIGSGSHAFGYLFQISDRLFQSPLSFYTRKKLWDVAPGYENSSAPDFARPVTEACLLCHAGAARPKPNSLNTYLNPPFAAEGITCERCHGPVEAHLRKPGRETILNPARLRSASRDSVCEQCHLAGEIRIPNPGKSFGDFRVGEALENTFTVYVETQDPGTSIKVVSHAEQLRLSACARNSGGKLWCGTCHDPHVEPQNVSTYYRGKCLGCHAASAIAPSHNPGDEDCIGCHMPKSDARDGGHTAFTDHWIRRRRVAANSDFRSGDLVPWREGLPRLADRNLALALVTHGIENASANEVIRGYKLMNRIESKFEGDAAFETALGTVLLKARQSVEAERRFQRALTLLPEYAPYEVNLAAALLSSGETAQALKHAEKAYAIDPLLESGSRLLATIYRSEGRVADAERVERMYRQAMGAAAVAVREASRP